jgi:hypothetical protein
MGIMGSPPGQPPPPGSSDAVNDLAGMGEGAVAAVMQAWANAAAAAAGASDGQQPAGNGPVSPGSGRALNPATLAVLVGGSGGIDCVGDCPAGLQRIRLATPHATPACCLCLLNVLGMHG